MPPSGDLSESKIFQRVPMKAAIEVWQLVRSHIEAVLARSNGEMHSIDVFEAILDGRFDLWLAYTKNQIEGCAVTQIVHFPRAKHLLVVIAGGENARAYVPEAMPQIEDYAREQGCNCVEITARKGWQKHLPEYEFTQVVLRKML